ncbi:resolvase [Staphylococcus phage vB_SauH_DELF3]|nr:resolvase [Staphylococcus phage vB_SauH_DELF3]
MTANKKKGHVYESNLAKANADGRTYRSCRCPGKGVPSWGDSSNSVGRIVAPLSYRRDHSSTRGKDRENWTLDNVLLNNKEPHTWWQQVVGDAEAVDKSPCLIFKRKYSQIYVAMKQRNNRKPIIRTEFIIETVRKDETIYDELNTTMLLSTSLRGLPIMPCYSKRLISQFRVVSGKISTVSKQKHKGTHDKLAQQNEEGILVDYTD